MMLLIISMITGTVGTALKQVCGLDYSWSFL